MGGFIESILTGLVITQEAQAEPWVEYSVYGGMLTLILFFVVKAITAPKDRAERPAPPAPETRPSSKSDEDREAEARRLFEIPHVLMGEASQSGRPKVQILRTENDSTPSTSDVGGPGEVPPAVEPASAAENIGQEAPAGALVESAGKTLRDGLTRTRNGFVQKLGRLFGQAKVLDDDLLGDLEEALFTADIGVRTSQSLVEFIQASLSAKALQEPAQVWDALKGRIREILLTDAPRLDTSAAKPFVIMVVGVNGAGKTTTIGKLASLYGKQGKKVMLAAGDTFRAAAVEQLEVWGERAGADVVKGKSKQDPSSVIFEACARAGKEGYDVCIADTAGRLQAKQELMEELKKVHRVMNKALPGAPHEVWLVLDSTNGQNAISQAKEFTQAVDVSGLVLTKLDGTAKGGVVIGISDEMKLPVRYIGIGEKVEDLRTFEPNDFADALFS